MEKKYFFFKFVSTPLLFSMQGWYCVWLIASERRAYDLFMNCHGVIAKGITLYRWLYGYHVNELRWAISLVCQWRNMKRIVVNIRYDNQSCCFKWKHAVRLNTIWSVMTYIYTQFHFIGNTSLTGQLTFVLFEGQKAMNCEWLFIII